MPAVRAVLFDVFETLLFNRREQWEATFQEICRLQGLPIHHLKLFKAWKVDERSFRRSRVNLDDLSQSPPFVSYCEAWRDCFTLAFARFRLRGDEETAVRTVVQALTQRQPYPDALEALPSIQRKWRTGILSNADDAFLLPALQRHGLRFAAILSSEQARMYKPDPRVFHQALRMLEAEVSETVYVGDSLYDDILGAKLVGMRVAWLNRDGRHPEDSFPTPDYEIRSLTELIPVLGG